jgi:hypothetical protein
MLKIVLGASIMCALAAPLLRRRDLIPSKSAHAPNFVNRFDAPHDAALSQASFAWANPLKTHAPLGLAKLKTFVCADGGKRLR